MGVESVLRTAMFWPSPPRRFARGPLGCSVAESVFARTSGYARSVLYEDLTPGLLQEAAIHDDTTQRACTCRIQSRRRPRGELREGRCTIRPAYRRCAHHTCADLARSGGDRRDYHAVHGLVCAA